MKKNHLTYMTQLNSYAIMFEKPDQNYLKLNPVKNLGIFCFEPENLKIEKHQHLKCLHNILKLKEMMIYT